MNLIVWPYLKIENNWTISDEIISAAWDKMVGLNRVEPTWYDGSVKTREEFDAFLRDPYLFPVFVADADTMRLWVIAWLNDIVDGTARAHFCYLDRYHSDVFDKVLDYWKKIESLRVITGITPESYKLVLRIIQRGGFQTAGTIPQICNMHYENRREGAVVSYYLTRGEDNGREQKQG